MRKFYLKRLARTAFCLCLLHNLSWSCIPATAKQESLKASVSQTTETDKLEALGIKSVIHVDTDRKQTIYVDSVRMGSKSFYKGVEAGDIVRGMAQKGNVFCLNIELIIDITGAMKLVDGTDGLTKFEWCHQQVSNLAQKLAPYLKNLTITTFNTEFNTETNCSVNRVEQIYAQTEPSGNTDLVDPLTSRLNAAGADLRLHPEHKELIAVITDGLPNVPKDTHVVNRAIVDFSHTLTSPDQLLVTFLQIGDTFDGQSFCHELDDRLVTEGAKYDIVASRTFDQLKKRGLSNALIDCVVDEKMYRTPGSERAEIERQLLGK